MQKLLTASLCLAPGALAVLSILLHASSANVRNFNFNLKIKDSLAFLAERDILEFEEFHFFNEEK